jgi:hypothetical protein
MYLLGYSLNIFSLMALTVATGFVGIDLVALAADVDAALRTRALSNLAPHGRKPHRTAATT